MFGVSLGTPEYGFAGVAYRDFWQEQVQQCIDHDGEPKCGVEQEWSVDPDEVEPDDRAYNDNAETEIPIEVLLHVECALAAGRARVDHILLQDSVGECDSDGRLAVLTGRFEFVIRFRIEGEFTLTLFAVCCYSHIYTGRLVV